MQTGTMLRPMSLGELLDASFGVYRRQFLPLVFIALLCQAIPLALGVYLELQGGVVANPALWAVSAIAAILLGSIGSAASTFVVAEAYLGGQITPQQAFSRAVPFLGRLIAAALLSALLYVFGLLLLVIPGIIVICGLAVTAPAIVIENQPSATAGMSRSWNLSKGLRMKVFVAFIVVFLLIALPGIALGAVGLVAAGEGTTELGLTIGFLLIQSVLQVLAYPFFYVLTTLLYYDFRVRKEAYDLDMLSAALGSPA